MPFCTQCGAPAGPAAVFCPNCGSRQLPGPAPIPAFGSSISDRNVSILCYIPFFGVIPSILVLLAERYRHNLRIRFDAFQSLYLFLANLVVDAIGPTMIFAGVGGSAMGHVVRSMLKLALIAAWVYLLVKATRSEQVRLPVIGDLAARSTYEQL